MPFFVIGHRNPDTDAICSAIGHAALLRLTGEPTARAARCGELTPRTAWVLEEAGVEPPELIDDVRTTAGMMCRRDVVHGHPRDSVPAEKPEGAFRQDLVHRIGFGEHAED